VKQRSIQKERTRCFYDVSRGAESPKKENSGEGGYKEPLFSLKYREEGESGKKKERKVRRQEISWGGNQAPISWEVK